MAYYSHWWSSISKCLQFTGTLVISKFNLDHCIQIQIILTLQNNITIFFFIIGYILRPFFFKILVSIVITIFPWLLWRAWMYFFGGNWKNLYYRLIWVNFENTLNFQTSRWSVLGKSKLYCIDQSNLVNPMV